MQTLVFVLHTNHSYAAKPESAGVLTPPRRRFR